MQATEDATLLREYATNNSQAAFETLIARHASLVHSAAVRQVRDPHLAEEVSQTVFILLAKKAGQIHPQTALAGWLYNTTRFVALAQIRLAARRHKYEQEAPMPADPETSEPESLWEQILPLLDEAMSGLGEKDRRAVLLRFFENKSLAEVAASFDTGEDAARMRINRALEKLRRFFARRGVTATASAIAGAVSANSLHAAPANLISTLSTAALTQGTASTSHLPLIKAALKLMAWTKTKTTAAAASAALLALGITILSLDGLRAWQAARYPDIQGAWEGVMMLDYDGVGAGEAARTHVVLRLNKTKNGYTAATDWIEMGRKDVPLGAVAYAYPSLQIVRGPNDIWKFKINAEATQMVLDHSIHFIQPDPVFFQRTTAPDPVPARLTEADFAPHSGVQGYWEGEFTAGSNTVPLNVKIAEQGGGAFHGEISWPVYGIGGLPVTGSYQGALVKFSDNIGQGLFQGAISDNDTRLTGSWTQAGRSIPAVFKRADFQAEHALDAERDYSFRSENDLQGHWRGTWEVTIASTKASVHEALDIARLPDGSYVPTLSKGDLFGSDGAIPPSVFQWDPPHIHLEWKWSGGAYDGNLQGGKLVGTWLQGGGGFSLNFERIRGD